MKKKGSGKFYCTFKVHKEHPEGSIPPERPIVSNSGSTLENIGLFIEHHIKDIANKHPTFIQDTPDLLRQIEILNEGEMLPADVILVSMDISSLYTNIPHSDAVECVKEALGDKNSDIMLTDFIIELLNIVLKFNIFEFDKELFLQLIGVAMGSRPSPSIANIFLAKKIDPEIFKIAKKYSNMNLILTFFKRFLDDLFLIFHGSTKLLHNLFSEINQIHPSINFTMTHTSVVGESDPCDCDVRHEISFLDTRISVKNGRISTDLYKKPTDRNLYLLPSSCHPPQVISNIPYSLALRIVRICSENDTRDLRLNELRQLLIDRNYSQSTINSAINRAKTISRSEALRYAATPRVNTRPVYVATYDPRLPNVQSIVQKHWRSMTSVDPYLAQVFPEPPLMAFKRQRNLKDFLVRAKVQANKKYTNRQTFGMKKCKKQCVACPFIMEGKTVKCDTFLWNIRKDVNCDTKNIIYMIECTLERCRQRYIGESGRKLSKRFSDHKGYVKNHDVTQATGKHFNEKGHNLSHMKITIIEKVKKDCEQYRKEREKYFIKKFNTFYNGLNKHP